jgi:voltage-gated potassium channel Kch
MTPGGDAPRGRDSLIERRVQRIINARSVTVGLAVTFIGVATVGGIVIRLTDPHNFTSVGLGIWWALQTVTTVGYGDVVPTTVAGRIVGSVEMGLGVAFIAFVTAGVTSALIQRSEVELEKAERERSERNTQTIMNELGQARQALTELRQLLQSIDDKIARPNE